MIQVRKQNYRVSHQQGLGPHSMDNSAACSSASLWVGILSSQDRNAALGSPCWLLLSLFDSLGLLSAAFRRQRPTKQNKTNPPIPPNLTNQGETIATSKVEKA